MKGVTGMTQVKVRSLKCVTSRKKRKTKKRKVKNKQELKTLCRSYRIEKKRKKK